MTSYGREEVQLHTLLTLYCCTLCGQTISWPLFEVLTFLFLHNISLANKCSRWPLHSLHILITIFLWVIRFLHNLPTQPGTKRDLGTIWVCVVSLTLNLHYTWEKCWVPSEQEAGWAWDLAWSSEVKNLLNLPGTLLQLLIHLFRPHTANHTNCTITATLLQSVLSWIYVIFVKSYFSSSHFSFGKKWI